MVTGIGQSNFAPVTPFMPPPPGSAEDGFPTSAPSTEDRASGEKTQSTSEDTKAKGSPDTSTPDGNKAVSELTREEQLLLQEMKRTDREVRQHERAHMAAGGRYVTSGATFTYEKGPDGRLYAVGGEVSISTSKEASPEATLRKAQTIRRAALAPAEPSPQDKRVAAQATQLEYQAHRDIAEEELAEIEEQRDADRVEGAPSSEDIAGETGLEDVPDTADDPIQPAPSSPSDSVFLPGRIIDLIG